MILQIVLDKVMGTTVLCHVTVEVMVTVTTPMDAYVMMDGVGLTAVWVSLIRAPVMLHIILSAFCTRKVSISYLRHIFMCAHNYFFCPVLSFMGQSSK